MLSTLLSLVQPLIGRALFTLFALQGLPAPSGGGAAHPASGGSGSGGGGPWWQSLLFPAAVGGFLYFVMIRPMSKQRKDQDSLQKTLVKGDKVVTTSGIVATVVGVDDQFVTLEISERVRVKFLRESISRKFDPNAATSKSTSAATAKPADVAK